VDQKLGLNKLLNHAGRVYNHRAGGSKQNREQCFAELMIAEHIRQVMLVDNVSETEVFKNKNEHGLSRIGCLGCFILGPHFVALYIANLCQVLEQLTADLLTLFRGEGAQINN
jgi:hypothetical protein